MPDACCMIVQGLWCCEWYSSETDCLCCCSGKELGSGLLLQGQLVVAIELQHLPSAQSKLSHRSVLLCQNPPTYSPVVVHTLPHSHKYNCSQSLFRVNNTACRPRPQQPTA